MSDWTDVARPKFWLSWSLRIAVPTWRSIGITRTPEPRKAEVLSRAELAGLLAEELKARG